MLHTSASLPCNTRCCRLCLASWQPMPSARSSGMLGATCTFITPIVPSMCCKHPAAPGSSRCCLQAGARYPSRVNTGVYPLFRSGFLSQAERDPSASPGLTAKGRSQSGGAGHSGAGQPAGSPLTAATHSCFHPGEATPNSRTRTGKRWKRADFPSHITPCPKHSNQRRICEGTFTSHAQSLRER